MKYLYTSYIWTVGLVLFVLIAILSIILLSFIPAKKFSPVFKFLVRFLVMALLIRVDVSGIENFTKDKSCLIMSNHVSFLDPVLLAAFTPFHTIGIEVESHFKWPVYGMLVRKHGNLPINRGSALSSKKTFDMAEQKLKDCAHIVIFPEGGRTENGKLMPFKKLPFMLAKNSECEILPLGINGVYEMNNKNSFLINPIKIVMQFGKPIPADTVTSSTIQELLDHTRSKIVELLDEKYV